MRAAWVVNTNLSATSRYQGLPYKQLVQLGGRLLCLGDTGFFALDGDNDDGTPVAAGFTTGILDFGSEYHKRLGNVYFGYTSGGALNLTVEPMDSGPSYSYVLPAITDDTPRAGRAHLGKGLWAKYFRFVLTNDANGSYFNVNTMAVDVAASTIRRV